MRLVEEEKSTSNRRFRVELDDGARVESVLYRGDSLCVSTQVGCAVACPFCASGAQGFGRNLTVDEMVGQVEQVIALGHTILRTTLSGVGDPMHNSDACLAFIDWCRARDLPPTITTTGGPLARLPEWLRAVHNGLTLSIHSGTESTRKQLMPRGPALAPLFELLAEELPKLSRRKRRRTTLAYLVLADANDDDANIDAFIERSLPLGLRVDLYAYNPVATSSMRAVTRPMYEAVYHRMTETGLDVRMSSQARRETNGGCGTLLAVKAPAS